MGRQTVRGRGGGRRGEGGRRRFCHLVNGILAGWESGRLGMEGDGRLRLGRSALGGLGQVLWW